MKKAPTDLAQTELMRLALQKHPIDYDTNLWGVSGT